MISYQSDGNPTFAKTIEDSSEGLIPVLASATTAQSWVVDPSGGGVERAPADLELHRPTVQIIWSKK